MRPGQRCLASPLLTQHSVSFQGVRGPALCFAAFASPGGRRPVLRAVLRSVRPAGLPRRERWAGPPSSCTSANPVPLSLSSCRLRAVRAALRAQRPPQLQLPRLLQSQLGAGQPGGE